MTLQPFRDITLSKGIKWGNLKMSKRHTPPVQAAPSRLRQVLELGQRQAITCAPYQCPGYRRLERELPNKIEEIKAKLSELRAEANGTEEDDKNADELVTALEKLLAALKAQHVSLP